MKYDQNKIVQDFENFSKIAKFMYELKGKIEDLALTASGSFALVSIAAKRAGTANLVWSLSERRVLAEFEVL